MIKGKPGFSFIFRAVAAVLLLAALGGCAGPRSAAKSGPAAKSAPAKAVFSAAEQKKAYDRGMKFYTQEQYKEARKAWQEAVRMGPSTPVGKQAQDYLRDVERTIRTLEGIQGK